MCDGRRAAPFVLILTLVFLGASGALLAGVFYPPVAAAWRARAWLPLRCLIDQAEVAEHRDSQGSPRYSSRVRYRYALGGAEHVGRRVSFLAASHTRRARAEAEIADLHPGATAPCYADPSAPDQAVLDRSLGRLTGWVAAPLVWIAVTLVVIRSLLAARPRRQRESR